MNKSLRKAFYRDIGPIVFRNLFSIVAVIIGGLSIVLIILGNKRDGLFLGSIITINILVGIIQEIRAKINLEKLQLSTKQKYTISRNGNQLELYSEDIIAGDVITIKLGDQCPVDGVIVESESFECNLALLTGESENVTKNVSDKILSGSIAVAGSAQVKASKAEKQSYLSKMNVDLKKYQTSYSPIQIAILKFIKIMAIILLILGIILIARSLLSGESILNGFVQVAALASTIIAEGLLLASTVLFAYGAIRLAKQKVLLQQINAIENLGRMSVVCIDKTGTLTQSNPSFDELMLYDNSKLSLVQKILSTYSKNETSQTSTLKAIEQSFGKFKTLSINNLLAFSSARKYSAFNINKTKTSIIIGAGDKFVKYLSKPEQEWFKKTNSELTRKAKRVIFIGEGEIKNISNPSSIKSLKLLGLAVFSNPLKSGVQETVKQLQVRGVQIVVISGDNAQTVEAIANRAGIEHSGKIITGDELGKMNPGQITELIDQRALFARTLPSQKQKIIEAIKLNGKNVAMVGDGANDAMAIKSADIGIAMFDGAPASRQIADAVLVNNSFNAIPSGIRLSDTIITTLEMIACLFFTRVWSGIFLLLITLMLRIDYPLSPRNITLLNVFIITLPIILWVTYPRHRDRKLDDPNFLERTLPFSVFNAIIISATSLISVSLLTWLKLESSQIPMLVFIIFFIMSIYSIGLIPRALGTKEDKQQQIIIYAGYVLSALILACIYFIYPLSKFFSLSAINPEALALAIALGYSGTAIQYIFARFKIADKFWRSIKRG
jgi:cation-transporting ATPase E